jgi:phosphomannomutase
MPFSLERYELGKTLIVSTSGVRGIVGGGLDPVLATRFAAGFATLLKKGKVVVGRDSRVTGDMISRSVVAGLVSCGLDVIDIGMVPTPTVEIAVTGLKAVGGICITASHNGAQWNALKFFDHKGEFIDNKSLNKLKKVIESEKFAYMDFANIGMVKNDNSWVDRHIAKVLKLPAVDVRKIRRAKFKVVVDAINGAGSIALPRLLESLGVKVIRLNCNGDGKFVHEPEPIPKNLTALARAVRKHKADLGMACDPDADRLALVDEHGRAIGEELTLALAVKYIMSRKKGKVVINLSTSRVTQDAAEAFGGRVHYTPVGEANVVAGIRHHRAVIGGEGNGGVIYPACHAGRDALVGAALICSLLAHEKKSLSETVETLPKYYTIKQKAALPDKFNHRLAAMEKAAKGSFEKLKCDHRDGVRCDFSRGWFQVRTSNTEPIFRVIVETDDKKLSEVIAAEVMSFFK